MLTSSVFALFIWGIFYGFSKMIGKFPEVLNSNRLLSNSTGSSATNHRFFPDTGPIHHCRKSHLTKWKWLVLHAGILALYLAMILKRPKLLCSMYSLSIFNNMSLYVFCIFSSTSLQLCWSYPPPKTYSNFEEIVILKSLANRASCHFILFVFLGTRIACRVIWIEYEILV